MNGKVVSFGGVVGAGLGVSGERSPVEKVGRTPLQTKATSLLWSQLGLLAPGQESRVGDDEEH